MTSPTSGNIAITVIPHEKGHCICEVSLAFQRREISVRRFYGQTSNHAIAMALEDLAREFRMEAEAEQNIDWDATDVSPTGKVKEKHFHVVVHFERVIDDESKFEAMHSTLMGNTVVENAEVSLVQVDPKLPIAPWQRRRKQS